MTKKRKKEQEQLQEQSLPQQLPNEDLLVAFEKKYQHDAFCKKKLKELKKAKEFLKFVLEKRTQDALDIDKLVIEPDSYVDEELRRHFVDILYRVPVKNGKRRDEVFFALLELKVNNDQWTMLQVAQYIVNIWKSELDKVRIDKRLNKYLLPMITPIIFYSGDEPFTAPTEMIDLVQKFPGMEAFVLNVRAILFDVTSMKVTEFPEDIGLNVLFRTLQAVFSPDVAERMMDIYNHIEPTLASFESQQDWEDAIYYATTS
ncbi:MAG: Rpn family recombination-promoting nuclease/putative transposase, partial [Planctomycetaceae bacterium]|nr:Rpn family recombination-promoting nuclease/putative transposase [Planctomycetaceae bacterium]